MEKLNSHNFYAIDQLRSNKKWPNESAIFTILPETLDAQNADKE